MFSGHHNHNCISKQIVNFGEMDMRIIPLPVGVGVGDSDLLRTFLCAAGGNGYSTSESE